MKFFSQSFSNHPPSQPKKKWTHYLLGFMAFALVATSLSFNPLQWFRPALLRVGNKKIHLQDFDLLWRQELALAALQPDGRQQDHPSLILVRLLRNQLLDQEIEKIGIGVSEKAAKEAIVRSNVFAPAFSEQKMNHFLSVTGLSWSQLLQAKQKEMIRFRFLKDLSSQTQTPSQLRKWVQWGKEQRRQAFVKKISYHPLTPLEPAKKEDLMAIYRQQSQRMQSPEYRTFSILYVKNSGTLDGVEKKSEKSSDHFPQDIMDSWISRIENQLGEGKSFQEISQRDSVPYHQMISNGEGIDPYGNKLVISGIPEETLKLLIQKVHQMSLAQDDMIQLPSGDCLWIRLEAIQPAHAMTYEEAYKAKILDALYLRQIQKKVLIGEAEKFISSLTSPQSQKYFAEMQKIGPVSENQALEIGESENPERSEHQSALIKTIFSLSKGGISTLWNKDKSAIYVVALDQVFFPQQQSEALNPLIDEHFSGTFFHAFFQSLEKNYPIQYSESFPKHIKKLYQSYGL